MPNITLDIRALVRGPNNAVETDDDPWAQGFDARQRDAGEEFNPFAEGERRQLWFDGWREAESELNDAAAHFG